MSEEEKYKAILKAERIKICNYIKENCTRHYNLDKNRLLGLSFAGYIVTNKMLKEIIELEEYDSE